MLDIYVFKSGTNRFLSGRVYSILVLLGKNNLDPKILVNFLFEFGQDIFRSILVRIFVSRLKCSGLILSKSKQVVTNYQNKGRRPRKKKSKSHLSFKLKLKVVYSKQQSRASTSRQWQNQKHFVPESKTNLVKINFYFYWAQMQFLLNKNK